MGAKYKPMARKVLPVVTYDPEAPVPIYQPIEIGKLDPLPINPTNFESLDYLGRLSKEHIAQIVAHVPWDSLLSVRWTCWSRNTQAG